MKTKRLLLTALVSLTGILRLVGATPVDEIIVEALVDGDTEFHVRPETIWWENGTAFKVGKWSGQDQPTFINGVSWIPRWRDDKHPKGKDKTAPYAVTLKSTELEFELLAVTKERGETGIEKRSPVTAKQESGHFVVRIPDPETGGRWYKFVVRKKK